MLQLLNTAHSACLDIYAHHFDINWITLIKRDYLSNHCFYAPFCYQGTGQVFMLAQFSKRVSSMRSILSVSYFRIKMEPLTLTTGQQYVMTTATTAHSEFPFLSTTNAEIPNYINVYMQSVT